MAGRGPQTFKKRQKEQQRRERQQEKFAKRLQRKQEPKRPLSEEPLLVLDPETGEPLYPLVEGVPLDSPADGPREHPAAGGPPKPETV